MLIKRNVYFSAIDEDGEERLYSTTEVMDEQDYIERLYAEVDAEDAKAAGIGAAAALGATGLAGAGMYGAGVLERHGEKKLLEKAGKDANIKSLKKTVSGLNKSAKKATGWAKEGTLKSRDFYQKVLDKDTKEFLDKNRGAVTKYAGKVNKAGKAALNWARGHKLAATGIGLGTLAVGGAGGYGVRKLRGRKNSEE